jgi:hypothetical protein
VEDIDVDGDAEDADDDEDVRPPPRKLCSLPQ